MDLIAELANSREYSGGAYTWGYFDDGDSYSNAFRPMLVKIRGFTRFKEGDNRSLIIRGDR